MFGPVRLWFSLRAHPDTGLVAAAVAVAVLFAATPFILTPISDEYGVSVGAAGLLSTAQVAGFAVVAFVAGRTLRTHRRYLVIGSLTAVAANLASIPVETFEVLLLVRVIAGGAAGLLVWLSWANAMRTSSALRTVAAVGPVSVLVAVPIMSALAESQGSAGVFLTVAIVSAPAAFLPARFAGYRPLRRKMSPSRSNVVLVVVLGVITMSGSSLFVFAATLATTDLGMAAGVVSASYSANALAGLIAARRHADERLHARWTLGIAVSAAAVAFGGAPILFVAGLVAWGFSFWMATPNILRAIAAWSLAPDERVGDAQSAMAVGRAIGPAVASWLVVDGSFDALGAFAVVGLTLSAIAVALVARHRRSHANPAAVRSS